MAALDWQDLLRIMCGAWLLPHAILKIKNASLAQQTFAGIGLKPGPVFLWLTIALEFLAAAGLIFDIFPRIAAGLAVFVLAGASYAVLKMHGFAWRWNKSGPEYMVFWSLATVIAVI
ncbi:MULTISPECIES: DoxX family protein [Aurantiacibacter]|uniref:DoxX family protein n=1 Tax=Aurantiacibacter flavus TaxID=3145232 RepID=A0ABV0D075_9SPHN|nr:DoxX family protein [Aurantiacibacter suaedae]